MSYFGEEISRKEIIQEYNIRWEDSVKMYRREIGYLAVECIHLAQAREVIIVQYVKSLIVMLLYVTIAFSCE